MTSLADLQRPEFQDLSPEARTLVFDKIAGQDAGYGKLSAEAQNLVRLKLLGVARSPAMSEIPTAGAPQAPAAASSSRMDQFFEGVKQSIPAHLLAGVNRGARDITGTLLSAVGGAPAKAAEAKAKGLGHV